MWSTCKSIPLHCKLLAQDMIADFACDCPAGYTGETCSDDIDECLEANCPGNSTCVQDAVDSFLCQCNPGFEGVNCTGEPSFQQAIGLLQATDL